MITYESRPLPGSGGLLAVQGVYEWTSITSALLWPEFVQFWLPCRRWYNAIGLASSRSHRKKYACAPFVTRRAVFIPRVNVSSQKLITWVEPSVRTFYVKKVKSRQPRPPASAPPPQPAGPPPRNYFYYNPTAWRWTSDRTACVFTRNTSPRRPTRRIMREQNRWKRLDSVPDIFSDFVQVLEPPPVPEVLGPDHHVQTLSEALADAMLDCVVSPRCVGGTGDCWKKVPIVRAHFGDRLDVTCAEFEAFWRRQPFLPRIRVRYERRHDGDLHVDDAEFIRLGDPGFRPTTRPPYPWVTLEVFLQICAYQPYAFVAAPVPVTVPERLARINPVDAVTPEVATVATGYATWSALKAYVASTYQHVIDQQPVHILDNATANNFPTWLIDVITKYFPGLALPDVLPPGFEIPVVPPGMILDPPSEEALHWLHELFRGHGWIEALPSWLTDVIARFFPGAAIPDILPPGFEVPVVPPGMIIQDPTGAYTPEFVDWFLNHFVNSGMWQPWMPGPILPPGSVADHIPVDALIPHFLDAHPFLAALCAGGQTVCDVIADVATGVHHVAPVVMPVLRVLQWYLQDFNVEHSPERIYRRSPHRAAPGAQYEIGNALHLATVGQLVQMAGPVQIKHDLFLEDARRHMRPFDDTNNINRALSQQALNSFNQSMNDRARLPMLRVAANVTAKQHQSLYEAFPDFRVLQCSAPHPHGPSQAVRTGMFAYVADMIHRRFPTTHIRGIGLSPQQATALPNLVHHDGPQLTGRDVYRHNHAYGFAQTTAFAALNHQCTFENCKQNVAPVAVSAFSTQDIHLADFAVECIRSGVHTAYAMMNIPVTFLDKHITRQVDELNNVRYERNGEHVDMYFGQAASPGYHNNLAKTLSWASPMPRIPGYNIQLEELRRFGTTYVFELRISEGAQEILPTMFTLSSEEFIVLTHLRPLWRDLDNQRSTFSIPSRRFRSLVAFVSGLDPGKVTFSPVSNKLRGQLGEVRIGDVIVENRWDLEASEFYSVVGHAILAAELYGLDYSSVMPVLRGAIRAEFWRHGNVAARLTQYVSDLFTFRLASRFQPLAPGLATKIGDRMFGNNFFHGDVDPYVQRNHYRLLNMDTLIVNRTINDIPGSIGSLYNGTKNTAFAMGQFIAARSTNFGRMFTRNDINRPIRRLRRPRPVVPEAPRIEPVVQYPEAMVPLPEDDDRTWTLPSDATEGRIRQYLHDLGTQASDEDVAVEPIVVEEIEVVQPPIAERVIIVDDADEDSEPEAMNIVQEPSEPEVVPTQDPYFAPSEQSSEPDSIGSIADIVRAPAATATVNAFTTPLFEGRRIDQLRMPDIPADILGNVFTPAPFHPELPTYPPPLVQSNVARQFYRLYPDPMSLERHLVAGTFDLNVPDNGAGALLERAYGLPKPAHVVHVPINIVEYARENGYAMRRGDTAESLIARTDGMQQHILKFFNDPRMRHNRYRLPSAVVSGVPSAAKSSIIIPFIRDLRLRALVVVPGSALKRQWITKLRGTRCEVVKQHQLPKNVVFDVVIVDEAYTFARRHLNTWAAYADHIGSKVVYVGDPDQVHDEDIARIPVDDPVFCSRRLNLLVANSMPMDATVLVNRVKYRSVDAGTLYQTRSPKTRSVFILDAQSRQLPMVGDVELATRPRKDVAANVPRETISIGQSQGLRVKTHIAALMRGLDPANWLGANNGARVIQLSRHTEWCIFTDVGGQFQRTYTHFPVIYAPVVNGIRMDRLLGQRQVYPFDLDFMPQFRTLEANHVELTFAGVPIDSSMNTGETMTSRNSDYEVRPREDPEWSMAPSKYEMQGFVYGRTNFDLAKDHEHAIDFNEDNSSHLRSIGEIAFPTARTDMRNDLDEVHKMADVQVSQSRYEDLRNILTRQFQASKSPTDSANVFVEAKLIFDRFVECYVDLDKCVQDQTEDFSIRWLSTRAPSFLKRLEDDPFGESARSVSFHAFLKQQTKFKAKPGYPAEINYGQTVIANEAAYSATLGPAALAMYSRTRQFMRDDWIPDIALSDEELSELCRRRGLFERFEADNVQIDVTKQDSSHTAEIVLAFCMWIDFLGFDPELSELYFVHCSKYAVVSQAPNLYSGDISFNLASGDPFTLLRNFFQFCCVFGCRYVEAKTMAGIEKGDDFIGDCSTLTLHPLHTLNGVRNVQFKIAKGTWLYHAGRIGYQDEWYVDPVRAVAKHLCRVNDENVAWEELFQSYISRATVYPASVQRFFRIALPDIYTDFNDEEIDIVLRFAAHLRNRAYFKKYSTPVVSQKLIIDAPTDCAVAIAKHILPSRPARFYHQFRGCNQYALAAVFEKHTHIPVLTTDTPYSVYPFFRGIIIGPTHCWYRA